MEYPEFNYTKSVYSIRNVPYDGLVMHMSLGLNGWPFLNKISLFEYANLTVQHLPMWWTAP